MNRFLSRTKVNEAFKIAQPLPQLMDQLIGGISAGRTPRITTFEPERANPAVCLAAVVAQRSLSRVREQN